MENLKRIQKQKRFMKSGYKILWSDSALAELKRIIFYLEENWREKEISKFSRELENAIKLMTDSPTFFQIAISHQNLRRAVIGKHNTLYYRINGDSIEIISLFSHRQNPENLNKSF